MRRGGWVRKTGVREWEGPWGKGEPVSGQTEGRGVRRGARDRGRDRREWGKEGSVEVRGREDGRVGGGDKRLRGGG